MTTCWFGLVACGVPALFRRLGVSTAEGRRLDTNAAGAFAESSTSSPSELSFVDGSCGRSVFSNTPEYSPPGVSDEAFADSGSMFAESTSAFADSVASGGRVCELPPTFLRLAPALVKVLGCEDPGAYMPLRAVKLNSAPVAAPAAARASGSLDGSYLSGSADSPFPLFDRVIVRVEDMSEEAYLPQLSPSSDGSKKTWEQHVGARSY